MSSPSTLRIKEDQAAPGEAHVPGLHTEIPGSSIWEPTYAEQLRASSSRKGQRPESWEPIRARPGEE